jgi:hypothetical protein
VKPQSEDEQANDLETDLTDEDRAFLDELAEGITRRRLGAAAMFFLESMKPLGFVGSQLLIFLQPIVQIIWSNPARYQRLVSILERRGSVELLLRRLEARA